MRILVDTREQAPFRFEGKHYAGVELEPATLQSGDYSLAGLADRIAVERKSLDDLAQCLGRERERFERELQRARGHDFFAVVIEGSWQDLAHGNYRSGLNAHSACQSVMAFMARYGHSFFFAGNRGGAEYATYSLLRQYFEVARKRWKRIVEAHQVA